MNSVIETLKAARALITDPNNWMQGDYCNYDDSTLNSTKFCALGAIARVKGFDDGAELSPDSPEVRLLRACIKNRKPSVAAFNDTHTHEQVLALFDKAIGETHESR